MDKKARQNLRFKILGNRDIWFHKRRLRIPTIGEIADMGFNEFAEICFPFSLSNDIFVTDDFKIDTLSGIILSQNSALIESLEKGLRYFLRIDDNIKCSIVFKQEKNRVSLDFGGAFFVNNYVFSELREYILLITSRKEIKELKTQEEQINYVGNVDKSAIARLLANRKKIEDSNKDREIYDFMTMLNYIIINTHYSYEQIYSFNHYQILSLVNSIAGKERNDIELTKLSTGVISCKDLDIKGIHEQVKINNKSIQD